MYKLFIEGGSLFMGMLTLVFLLMIVQAIRTWILYSGNKADYADTRKNLGYVRSLGLLAFVLGIFGQLLGLYQAFSAIQEMGEVSASLLAGGLKVSMITTMYGTFILIISLILWMLLDASLRRKVS